MRSFSFLHLFFIINSVNSAALNVLHRSQAPGLASIYWAGHLNETYYQEDPSREARLHRKQPRWFPLPVSNRPGPRQVPNVTAELSPTPVALINTRPTPEPTGDPSPSTTVHITDTSDFSLILPNKDREPIGDAEIDGVSYCSPGANSSQCVNRFPEGFITAAAFKASDDGAFIQVTGCIDSSKFHLDPSDAGGQFDVRYPNGAQCTFGGYGASFIELVEPAGQRFCIRCCSSAGDQFNCNSHQDRLGCTNAIPGVYDFPDIGVYCG